MSHRPKFRFSLRDLLAFVAVSVIAMPWIVSHLLYLRESSRQTKCKENLRAIGVAMWGFQTKDPSGRLCSGASDFRLDGCIDTYGWLADFSGSLESSSLIDPGNPLKGTDALEQVLSLDPSKGDPDTPVKRMTAGVCGSSEFFGIRGGDGTGYFADTGSRTAVRAELVSKAFLTEKINTNYAVSWFLARGSVKHEILTRSIGNDAPRDHLCTDSSVRGFRSIGGSSGPLKASRVDRSRISSTIIPAFGCATPSSVLSRDLPVVGSVHRSLRTGIRLASTMTDGPAYWNVSDKKITWIAPGVPLSTQLECERNEPTTSNCFPPTGYNGNHQYLQDTRSWHSVHRGQLNVLMVDSSVRSFVDRNNDGLLNPGFKVNGSPRKSANTLFPSQYSDSLVELPPIELFSGVFIDDFYGSCCFE